MLEVRYRYDEALAALATRRFLSRYSRWWLVVTIAVLSGLLFAVQRMVWPAAVTAILALVYAGVLFRYRMNAKRLARRLQSPEVTVRADEDGMTFSFPGQQSTSAWSSTRVLWQFDDVWLFFPYGPTAVYTAIPTAAMTPEFRELVLAKMQASGATIR